MRKTAVLALAALLALAGQAHAQMTLMGAGVPKYTGGGGGGGYQGIVDVVASPTECWGFQACSAALAAINVSLFDLRNAADTTTTTIHAVSGGGINTTELSSSGCTTYAAGCKVSKVYGQVSGIHCQETTFANQPRFDPDGLASGKPALYSVTGTGFGLACSSIGTVNAPWTRVVSMKPVTTPGVNGRVFVGGDPDGLLYNSSGFAVFAGGLSSSTSAATGSWYAVVGQAGASSSTGSLRVNGTDTNGSLNVGGTDAISGNQQLLGTGTSTDGYVAHWAIYPTGLNSTQRADIVTNIRTWGGF